MDLIESRKKYIDSLSYKELLEHWRFAPPGNNWFEGETGEYWAKRMRELREKIGGDEHVRTSKEIGWKNI